MTDLQFYRFSIMFARFMMGSKVAADVMGTGKPATVKVASIKPLALGEVKAKREKVAVDLDRLPANWDKLQSKWSGRPMTGGSKRFEVTPARWEAGEKPPQCCKCGSEVHPGFCYTGRVLDTYINLTVDKTKFNPVTLEDEEWQEKIRVPHYVKGFICDTCSAEYRCHHDERSSRTLPIVVIDRLPMAAVRDHLVGGRTNKRLATDTNLRAARRAR